MNDHEEVHWGINHCMFAIEQSPMLKINLGDRYDRFIESLRAEAAHYGAEHLFDTYVFCLSAHTPGDDDGRLSMWRGYGGDGRGAAIVFNPMKLNQREGSPLILDRVVYKSTADRLAWAAQLTGIVNAILQAKSISEADLSTFAALVFQRIKLAAIFSKHQGFSEEQEWRVVYMPERDPERLWSRYFGYFNGPRGLEPKFKFKLAPVQGLTADDLSLEKIADHVILGPHRTSHLVEGSAKRMLEHHGQARLASTLKMSSIPYRSFN